MLFSHGQTNQSKHSKLNESKHVGYEHAVLVPSTDENTRAVVQYRASPSVNE